MAELADARASGARGHCPCGFESRFWRSVDLTGNQTHGVPVHPVRPFWRSVDLTGNQTVELVGGRVRQFWRSVDLTGNQTQRRCPECIARFGAVLI